MAKGSGYKFVNLVTALPRIRLMVIESKDVFL